MGIEREKILMLAVFLLIGMGMAYAGNFLMDTQQPIRQQSQLLENYFIMQSMAGKNITPNLTYMVGNYGLVVSFNDVVTDTGVTYHKKGPVNSSSGIIGDIRHLIL